MLNHPAVKLHFQLAFPACAWGAVPILFASNGVKVMATLNIPRMGKVLKPKTVITKEIGYCADFMDTEGNIVSLHSQG